MSTVKGPYENDYVANIIITGGRGKPFTHPDYEKLPEGVKMCMTEKEYCWLSDSEKLNIVDQFTMPEAVED